MSPLVFAALAPFAVGVLSWGAELASYRRRVPALGFLMLVGTGASAWALGADRGPTGLGPVEQVMVLAIPWLCLAWLDAAFAVTGRIADDLAWPLQIGAGVAVVTGAVVALTAAGHGGWASPAVSEVWGHAGLNGAVAGVGSVLVVYEYASARRPRRSPSVGRVGAALLPIVVHVALAAGVVPMTSALGVVAVAGAAGVVAWPLRSWGLCQKGSSAREGNGVARERAEAAAWSAALVALARPSPALDGPVRAPASGRRGLSGAAGSLATRERPSSPQIAGGAGPRAGSASLPSARRR